VVGEAEFRRYWRDRIWAPITTTCILAAASVSWFFASDDLWYSIAYMFVALVAVWGIWACRATYASLKAAEARLNLVLTILAAGSTESEAEDEPDC
jgi:membrane protein YdbS with pleckstrin-like domain